MRVAFIFGKGIDGCGVTKGAHIFEDWLYRNGHETIVVDFDNGQVFNRKRDTQWKGRVLEVKRDQTISEINDIVEAVNDCDIAIFHSHPTRKQYEYVERYRQFLERIYDPIIVMHDHSITRNNINLIPQAVELFLKADVIVPQSSEGYSAEAYTFLDEGLKDRIYENPVWINPESLDSYWKGAPYRRKHFLYIGRMSPLKDPAMICRIHPYLKDWELSLIGCEKSIASVCMSTDSLATNPAPYTDHFRPYILQYTLRADGTYGLPPKEQKKDASKHFAKSYDKYKYDHGMKELGSSFASWCGYRLKDPVEYGNRMEYTMIESFLLTLPVISRDFAEHAFSPEGKTWGSYDCALVAEAGEEKELAEDLERIWHNQREWWERCEECRRLIFKFNDIDKLARKFLEFVTSKGKKEKKVDFLKATKDYFSSAKERREKGEVVMSSPNSVLTKTPMILDNGKQIKVTGSTQKNDLHGFF